ncbi:MAG: hypothetical protein AAF871_00960 [Pseudomonadota bacterium]
MGRSFRIAYLIDPRAPGGTSSAVAAELRAIAGLADIRVYAVTSKMFSGAEISKNLREVFDELEIHLIWDSEEIAADVVVAHNLVFLKFETEFPTRIVTPHLVVVVHENFTRRGGYEPFDVAHALGLLARSGAVIRRSLAPVSAFNRETVANWLAGRPEANVWTLLSEDWHNICDHRMIPPTSSPADRRGRHSRAGFEKFPSLDAMDLCFPETAAANVILGADTFIRDGIHRPHWQMLPFGSVELGEYFDMIDFMVYFCAATLQESFGRVVTDAIAAGKVVITDKATAANFGDGVITAEPEDVSDIVDHLVANPSDYVRQATDAQARLGAFSAEAFRARHAGLFDRASSEAALS